MTGRTSSGPLNAKELEKLQWEYHKGTETRKKVIQDYFGLEITYASCMASVDRMIATATLDKNKIVARPIETELWDWLCRAAFHSKFDIAVGIPIEGDPLVDKRTVFHWVAHQCLFMGNPSRRSGFDEFRYSVPDRIPETRKIRAYKLGRRFFSGLGSVAVFAMGAAFTKAIDELIPAVANLLSQIAASL